MEQKLETVVADKDGQIYGLEQVLGAERKKN